MPKQSTSKKNPALKEPGEKPFCCHTTRHPLREEKREATERWLNGKFTRKPQKIKALLNKK
jgi:hypothetical protein